MKFKSLLLIFLIFLFYSCSESEIKLNQQSETLKLEGQWKVTSLKYIETIDTSIKGIVSSVKTENIGSNFSLTYIFNSIPNELTAEGVFDLETITESGKKEYSEGIKGIDGIFPPAEWLLENQIITLKIKDYTQEVEVVSFTHNTLELQYLYVYQSLNTLNSDSTTKTSKFHLTLERI